ncbi:hypothetical protein PIPA1_01100 [Pelosinus sp. IPA-1]|nr:hypothetical protein PIPA1_01100 [Pelosinus sp. IPA-1]
MNLKIRYKYIINGAYTVRCISLVYLRIKSSSVGKTLKMFTNVFGGYRGILKYYISVLRCLITREFIFI